ncbi:MAG: hypothetical protein GX024_09690 [Clostridiales bacterium]|nr:hypothetical protein [Clostridiales bacterium]
MILYTIVQPDYVYNHSRTQEFNEVIQRPEIIETENIKLEVVPLGQGLYRINRIISTNPSDYLKPQLQPGSEIKIY